MIDIIGWRRCDDRSSDRDLRRCSTAPPKRWATTGAERFRRRMVAIMESTTEAYVRNSMRPALRRQFQIIVLRIIAEGGGRAEIDRIRQAIQRAIPRCDRRYPVKVLADNGIIIDNGTTVELVEQLVPQQIASLFAALDERAVRTVGLRLEDASCRADQAEWQLLRRKLCVRLPAGFG